MNISENEINLILGSLKGKLNREEQIRFSEWLNSTDNKNYYYQIKDIWDSLHFTSVRKSINTEQDWQKFLIKLAEDEKTILPKKNRTVRYIRRAVEIAAVIIIVFGIGFFTNKLIPQKQMYATLKVPYGAKTQLDLPDGSKVWVNSGSSLTYPVDINQSNVTLFLEGEAYFDITKIEGRKLNVKTSTINIEVHGTAFNVRAYDDDNVVETTLVRGSISLSGSVGGKSLESPIILKPNQQATLVKGEQSYSVEDINNKEPEQITSQKEKKSIPKEYRNPSLSIKKLVEVSDATSWKNNKLVFKSQRFDELLVRMERWYNVNIILEDKDLSGSLYTGTFDKETIEQAMKALSLSLPFSYEIDKNQIRIKEQKTK